MATPTSSKASITAKTIPVAGILVDIYGLDDLPASCTSISCLWLLHGRLGKKEDLAPIASNCVNDWNQQRSSASTVGLIAVAFDQRNHGTREVHALANKGWKEGNEAHAQDMFSIFHGTVVDTSLLIDHLESFIDVPAIERHLVLGISLGGHACWQLFFSEPRITAVVVIIGCPDYTRVMTDRARLCKRETYLSSNGANFLGSRDFPKALTRTIHRWDPRGLIFGNSEIQTSLSESEQNRIRGVFDSRIKGKRLLVCSGGDDKLVPYHCSKPFLDFFKNATSGWYKDGNVYVEDIVYDGVGHAISDGMIKDYTRFICDILAQDAGKHASKI